MNHENNKDFTVLSRLNPDCDYQMWIDIGMILKAEGQPFSVWDNWSRGGRKYPGTSELLYKWNTFSDSPNGGLGYGTFVNYCKQHGVQVATSFDKYDKNDPSLVFDLDDILEDNSVPTPAEQFRKYIETLYKPGEFVNISLPKVIRSADGKTIETPGGGQNYSIDKILAMTDSQLSATIDMLNKAPGGAWVCINPVNAEGRKNSDVTNFRYVLVESDSMSIEKQETFYRDHQLPIKTLTYSGSKSLHAVVSVDAANIEEYKSRVAILYKYLEENGFKVDKANKNPSRLTRVAGFMRNGVMQRLVDTNIGCRSFNEWLNRSNDSTDDYPLVETLDLVNKPPLPEAIIEGILRRGHKMLLSGSSKAGKSFLLMELAVAFAEGTKWLNFQCKQGRVLYVNLEIDRASCIDRFDKIYDALKLDKKYVTNIDVWNLRGFAAPLNMLAPRVIRQMIDRQYIAVIFDPIYKIIMGDENNASEMGAFCNQFDLIAEKTKCAVIYCHHHSKGAQGGKKAQDRASGSGVFSRDPDAQLDMVELELTEATRNVIGYPITAWRMESCLREFANIVPCDFFFKYPIHELDKDGILKGSYANGDPKAVTNREPEEKKSTLEIIEQTVGILIGINGKASVKEVVESSGFGETTVRKKLRESDLYKVHECYIYEK
jgi:RecA-family ATPase